MVSGLGEVMTPPGPFFNKGGFMVRGYTLKAKKFASLKDGGHLMIFEVIQHPRITVTRRQETRNHNWTQTITVDMREFETLEKAIEFLGVSNG